VHGQVLRLVEPIEQWFPRLQCNFPSCRKTRFSATSAGVDPLKRPVWNQPSDLTFMGLDLPLDFFWDGLCSPQEAGSLGVRKAGRSEGALYRVSHHRFLCSVTNPLPEESQRGRPKYRCDDSNTRERTAPARASCGSAPTASQTRLPALTYRRL
jgi:hypothetical protein